MRFIQLAFLCPHGGLGSTCIHKCIDNESGESDYKEKLILFTKQNQEDYLIEKVLKLREQKAGNLIDETSEYKLGDFIHRAILGCPVPSSLNTMTEEEEYTDLWNDSAAIVISSLLEVASEVKSVDEIKKLIH